MPPLSVARALEDELDVGRGDLIAAADDAAAVARELEATVCWMADEPRARRRPLRAQAHDAHGARARLEAIDARARRRRRSSRDAGADALGSTTSAASRCASSAPLRLRPYAATARPALHPHRRGDQRDRRRGDDRDAREAEPAPRRANVVWQQARRRATSAGRALGQRGATIWLTGLPASGKSTIAAAVEARAARAGPRRLRARRRQPPPRAQRRPGLLAPRTAPRTSAGPRRSPR